MTLTQAEEAAVVAFRRHTLLPFSDHHACEALHRDGTGSARW